MVANEYSGCVYLATNTINGRAYIGKTVDRLFNRKATHKNAAASGRRTVFCHAIRKHGWGSFVWSQLFVSNCEAALLDAEVALIAAYRSAGVKLYNQTAGGEGLQMPCTEARRAKVAAALKGRKVSQSHRQKISEAMKGRRCSPEHIEKIRQSKLGTKLPPWTPERRAKVAATRAAKAATTSSERA